MNRIEGFDILKGMAIFIVVIDHVIFHCITEVHTSPLFMLASSIHMPLFFFISGYFSYRTVSSPDNAVAFPPLRRRFIQLIIPFLVVTPLWMLYHPHSGLPQDTAMTLHGLLYDAPKLGYWFTPVLYLFILLYACIVPVLRHTKTILGDLTPFIAIEAILLILSFTTSTQIRNLLSIEYITPYFPAFAFGVIFRRHQAKLNGIINDPRVMSATIILSIPALILSMYFQEFYLLHPYKLKILCKSLWHLCMAVIAMNLINRYETRKNGHGTQSPMMNIWIYLGRNSLAIYLLHYFLLFPLTAPRELLYDMNLNVLPMLMISVVAAAAIVTVTIGINCVIQRSRMLSLLLTGKA